jgi:hypothetical protein
MLQQGAVSWKVAVFKPKKRDLPRVLHYRKTFFAGEKVPRMEFAAPENTAPLSIARLFLLVGSGGPKAPL